MNSQGEAQDAMVTEASGDTSQSTQQTTQATQEASQQDGSIIDAHLWGYLLPCNPKLHRIDFHKLRKTYSIGRNAESGQNDIIFPGPKISNFHCKITWDGREDRGSAITVNDTSSNGTWINGERIGKGRHALLYEGNEIAFGSPVQQAENDGIFDYRFVFRHLAAGTPAEGLYAHYHLSEELGRGSFATVMKAMNRENGQWYAVKMIQVSKLKAAAARRESKNNEGVRPEQPTIQGYEREINILEKLRHPNICQLKEVFYEEHTINLVLEFVPGGDLLDYIVDRQGLSESTSQHITYQVCDALAYIHGLGVAHRDLKPENILCSKDDPVRIKVADFGLAKVVDSLTMLRTMCGTPCYLAPEVALQTHHQGYDQVVDSWSVGVIVFSMLTTMSPFFDSEGPDIQTQVSRRRIDWSILRNVPGIKPDMHAENFIMRLLQFRPEDRMTLNDARYHPWLHTQAATAGLHSAEHDPSTSSAAGDMDRDASMSTVVIVDAMAVDEAMSDLSVPLSQDIAIPGAYPPSESQHSRMTRRSVVLMERQESGAGLPEASWQLVSPDEAVSPEAELGEEMMPDVPRGAKRGRLRSIPEDREAVEPLQESLANARNRRRVAEPAAVGKAHGRGGRRAARGRGNAKGRVAKEELIPDAEDEEDREGAEADHRPRRSSRLAR